MKNRPLPHIWNLFLFNFNLAMRNISKYKTQNIISILSVSAGIFLFTFCASIIHGQLAKYNAIEDSDRIARLKFTDGKIEFRFPLGDKEKIQIKSFPFTEKYAQYNANTQYYCWHHTEGFTNQNSHTLTIDKEMTEILQPELVAGRMSDFFETPYATIISQSKAEKLYKESSPIGQIITTKLDGSVPKMDDKGYTVIGTDTIIHSKPLGGTRYTIVGVYKDLPSNTLYDFTPDMIIFDEDPYKSNSSSGVTLIKISESYRNKLPEIEETFVNETMTITHRNANNEKQKIPLKAFILNEIPPKIKKALTALGMTGFLILLAGWLNFIHFSIGTFYNRMKELRLRRIIGAKYKHLFGELFTEVALLLVIATFCSCLIAELVIPLLNQTGSLQDLLKKEFSPVEYYQEVFRHILFLLILSASICYMAILNINRKMNQENGVQSYRHRTRNLLIAVQLFITTLFIGLALEFYLSGYAMNKTLITTMSQEEKERTFLFNISHPLLQPHFNEIINELEGLSYVESLLQCAPNLLSENLSAIFVSYTEYPQYMKHEIIVKGDLLSFFHIEPLSPQHQEHTPLTVYYTPRLAEIFEETGKSAGEMRTASDIILLKDVPQFSPGQFAEILWYYSDNMSRNNNTMLYIKAVKGDDKRLKNKLQEIEERYIPLKEENTISTFAEELKVKQLDFLNKSALILAIITIIITLLGVYSTISLDTSQREKEVAIRKINGANYANIFQLFGKLYLQLLLVSVPTALLIDLLILRYIKESELVKFLSDHYQHPLFWVAVCMVVLIFVSLSVFSKILKTAYSNPAEVIKKNK